MIVELKIDLTKIDHTKQSFIEAINTDKTKEESLKMGEEDAAFVTGFVDQIDLENKEGVLIPARSEIAEKMLKELKIEQILFFASDHVARYIEATVNKAYMKKMIAALEENIGVEETTEEPKENDSIEEIASDISSSISEKK